MKTFEVWEIVETKEIADATVDTTFAFAVSEEVADKILTEVNSWKCDATFRKVRKPALKIYESIWEFKTDWCQAK